uniref:HTH CENPB-type domain-containing protein n=1 Tax=Salarias fasciatus TaxID=181472 RepID=A0A672HC26_SALFA
MAPVQCRNKKYDLKFKVAVVNYAEQNSGEAAARHFSVDPRRVREWRKNKTALQPSEELEVNMREWVIGKRLRHERVTRKMIRVKAKEIFTTVSDSSDERFSASAGWLDRFLHRNNFTCRRRTTIAQKDAKEFTENHNTKQCCRRTTHNTKTEPTTNT